MTVCPGCQFKNASAPPVPQEERGGVVVRRMCACCGAVLPAADKAPGLLDKLGQLAQFGLTTGPLLEPTRETD